MNVSPNQLRHAGFAETVRSGLRVSGVDASRLVLEITERLLVAEDAQGWAYLNDLRSDGVRIAIDDYGTGCASLAYLRQPAIDIMKVDRSFVVELPEPRGQALLEAMITLTNRLGLVQIVEGVETLQERDALLAMGCRYGQGYYFAPPLPVREAATWSATTATRTSPAASASDDPPPPPSRPPPP